MRHGSDALPSLERAKHYRFRAEELRTIADEWIESGIRETLTRIAKDCEHMAQRLEKQSSVTYPQRP